MDQDPASPLPPDARQTDDPSPPPPTDTERPAWMAGTPAYTTPTIDPSPSSTPKPSGARKGIVGIGVALAAFAGALAFKFVVPFILGSVAANAIGGVFGGPWEHLPAETREQLNQRAEAALGDGGAGLSDDEKGAKLVEMGLHGLTRLDDATLIRRAGLYKAALDATDETTCASILRTSMTGPVSDDDAKKLVEGFTTDQFGEWTEIWVRAFEAEAKGAPPARTVSDADSNAMYDAVFAAVSADELATIQALSVGTTVTDAEACQANRALYGAGLGLDDANLAAFALTDVAP